MISARTLYVAAFLSLCAVLATVFFAVRSVLHKQAQHSASADREEDAHTEVPKRRRLARRVAVVRRPREDANARDVSTAKNTRPEWTLLLQGIFLGVAVMLFVYKVADALVKE